MKITPTTTTEIDRAKRVILEIVRQSPGNRVVGKVRLAKAFYFAHLYFARNEGMHLTDWAIVKMPNGPGIHEMDLLVSELEHEGAIRRQPFGPYDCDSYEAIVEYDPSTALNPAEVTAVREAVEFIAYNSGVVLSEFTHELSHTWNEAEMGDELPISLDLLSDAEYRLEKEKIREHREAFALAWGQ